MDILRRTAGPNHLVEDQKDGSDNANLFLLLGVGFIGFLVGQGERRPIIVRCRFGSESDSLFGHDSDG